MSCGVVIYNLIGGLKSELSDLGLCPSSLISSKRGDSFSKILENGCRVSRQLNNILLFSGVTFCYSLVLRRRNGSSHSLELCLSIWAKEYRIFSLTHLTNQYKFYYQ